MFSSPSTPSDDYLFNYTSQLLEWGMLFLSLDDAAKEGDITRTIPHLKKCIPFFFSHSKLSKYLVECINFILQYEHASPLNKMRILEGSFVNRRGGSGMNVEADLVQEHAVRHQKELIRGLGANKTESAIKRATGASNLLSLVVGNFDRSLSVPQKSPNHTTSVNKEDVQIIRSAIESVKPLHHTPGRPCHSFHFLSPKFEVEQTSLLQVITKVKERIERGLGLVVDDDDNGDDVNLDNQ
ncbi:hypothetical protein FSP39_015088 [Pinctada imbricata]|uniref:DUF6589 domain-containing protein n=1 Tax=Pinctada imbricata TaxID=66713 RepID=A0AA88YIM1_PINIB|nr:hypothetical protein FSP39_015088 [Pinctada imbricata]